MSLRTLGRGDVVLVAFPYLEASGIAQSKVRPALIVSGQHVHTHTADVIVVAISSRPASTPLSTDIQLMAGSAEYKAAGLKMTSWIKVASLAVIPKLAITRRMGKVTPTTLIEVEKQLKTALELL